MCMLKAIPGEIPETHPMAKPQPSQPDDKNGGKHAGGETRGSLELGNDRQAIEGCIGEVIGAMEAMGYPPTSAFAVRLAMEEAIVNGFKHGNKDAVDSTVRVEWEAKPDAVTVSIEDSGPGYAPDAVPDPTEPDRLEIPSGRGLMLMRAYMSKIWHNERGNRVTMVYEKPDEKAAAGE